MALINRYFGAFFDVLLVFTPEIRASREGLVFKKFNFRTGSYRAGKSVEVEEPAMK